MGFTPLKDAITASRAGVMEQVYANYDAQLPRDLGYLANPKSNDPFIRFRVVDTLDADYIKQIQDEMGDAGWHRVTVKPVPGEQGVWEITAFRDEAKTAPAPAPQPQEPEAPTETDTSNDPAPVEDTPAEAEPAESTDSQSDPVPAESTAGEAAQTPTDNAAAQEPTADTDASEEPAAEPAPASGSTTDSTTESGTTERQNPLLTPKS